MTRRSARLRKTEKNDKNGQNQENIDSEDSSSPEENTDDSDEEQINGQEDSSSPEDDTPLIHLKDDSPPPKVPKKDSRAEEPEVKLKTEDDRKSIEDDRKTEVDLKTNNRMDQKVDQSEKSKTVSKPEKRKSPSPTNETVQNGDGQKITDANSNQEKQVKCPINSYLGYLRRYHKIKRFACHRDFFVHEIPRI